MNYELVDAEVEELAPFEGEEVYDLEMDDDTEHTFFANGILIHNSAYFSIKPLLDIRGIELVKDGKVSIEAKQTIKDVDTHLNETITKWAERELRSNDSRLVFKQESICDVAMFQQPKRYILHVLESEGKVAKKPFKYVGVEIARSTYSVAVKSLIKKVIESSMLLQDKKKADELYRQAFDTFFSMEIGDVSIRTKISDYEKQEKKIDEYGRKGKGTPIGASSAINYNTLLKKMELQGRYDQIGSGEKIKYFYAAVNRYNFRTMAFKGTYPSEINDHVRVDYVVMFEKLVGDPLDRFYKCIGWRPPQIGREVQTDLFDLFA